MRHVLMLGGYPPSVFEGIRKSKFIFENHPNAANLDRILAGGNFDAVVTSYRMGGLVDGFAVIEKVRAFNPNLPVIFTTGAVDPATIVRAMKAGAADYIIEPFDFPLLEMALQECLDQMLRRQRVEYMDRRLWGRGAASGVVAVSDAMRHILEQVERVKDSDADILITGESGTGKGALAKHIHLAGARGDRPFLDINCGALNASTLENELFGHEKGAYTGADRTTMGIFELAGNGTLFLDEIGVVDGNFQVKLLKALEDKKVRRVGGREDIDIDARVIAATNTDLEAAARDGRFREDLFYRLNVLRFHIPPLRERREDLNALLNAFMAEYRQRTRKNIVRVSDEVLDVFHAYRWPGNVRELRNVIERAFLLTEGPVIEVRVLPPETLAAATAKRAPSPAPGPRPIVAETRTPNLPSPPIELDTFLRDQEIAILRETLTRYRWNKTKTAAALGLKRATLGHRLKKLGVN